MTKTVAYLLMAMGTLSLALYLAIPTLQLFAIIAAITLTIGLTIITVGVVRIRMSLFVDSICHLPTPGPWVALTFDDGPQKETDRLLDILDQHQVKATFFCIGTQAEENAPTLLRMLKSGHTIGSHTYSHSWKTTLAPYAKVNAEIAKGADAIGRVIGKKPLLFRPPFGITNPIIGRAIRANGLISIGWNIRTFDTLAKNENAIFEKVAKQLKPGAIILMHDRLEATVDALPKILNEIKQQGLTPISLEEALNRTLYV